MHYKSITNPFYFNSRGRYLFDKAVFLEYFIIGLQFNSSLHSLLLEFFFAY